MTPRPGRLAAWLIALALAAPLAAGAQEASVLFVLDLSGSMWGRIEGREKIAVAREALTDVIGDLPSYVAVGLAAYGHRSQDDCEDLELVAPLGAQSPAQLIGTIASLQPKGQTPLSRALLLAFDEVALRPGSVHVVLISDGEETCGGDPCQLMSELRAAGNRVSYHVIGFDVTEEEREQLRCVADAGRGEYHSAESVEQLARALATVRRKVLEAVTPVD